MQPKAFTIMAQVSTIMTTFEDQEWEDMTIDEKGYAVNELSHAFASIFSDLIGFDSQ